MQRSWPAEGMAGASIRRGRGRDAAVDAWLTRCGASSRRILGVAQGRFIEPEGFGARKGVRDVCGCPLRGVAQLSGVPYCMFCSPGGVRGSLEWETGEQRGTRA